LPAVERTLKWPY